jgi:hypothetical protein
VVETTRNRFSALNDELVKFPEIREQTEKKLKRLTEDIKASEFLVKQKKNNLKTKYK